MEAADTCVYVSTSSLQNFLSIEVEELDQNNQVSLSVERKRGTFGRLTVHWAASGSLTDIYPTSGVVRTSSPHFKLFGLTFGRNAV